MATLEYWNITENYVVLKFGFPVDINTLVNDNFVLVKTDATPSETLVSPFDPIVVTRDYHPVSRELFLHWNTTLLTDSDYSLTIQDLESVFGGLVSDYTITFDTDGLNLATPNVSESEFTKEPEHVEDYSVKVVSDILPVSNLVLAESTTQFGIVSIYPSMTESFYIGPYDYQGKIEITFNHFIPSNFLNNQDFKLQKKSILNKGISSWQNVNTLVTQSSNEPVVSVYLPSQDTDPIYSYEASDLSDYVFWEEGYKYRLVISKNVGY